MNLEISLFKLRKRLLSKVPGLELEVLIGAGGFRVYLLRI